MHQLRTVGQYFERRGAGIRDPSLPWTVTQAASHFRMGRLWSPNALLSVVIFMLEHLLTVSCVLFLHDEIGILQVAVA